MFPNTSRENAGKGLQQGIKITLAALSYRKPQVRRCNINLPLSLVICQALLLTFKPCLIIFEPHKHLCKIYHHRHIILYLGQDHSNTIACRLGISHFLHVLIKIFMAVCYFLCPSFYVLLIFMSVKLFYICIC